MMNEKLQFIGEELEDEVVSIDFTLDEVDELIEELICIQELLESGRKYIEEKNENKENGKYYIRIHENRIQLINDALTKFMEKSENWTSI